MRARWDAVNVLIASDYSKEEGRSEQAFSLLTEVYPSRIIEEQATWDMLSPKFINVVSRSAMAIPYSHRRRNARHIEIRYRQFRFGRNLILFI